jgi:hypothetical protein
VATLVIARPEKLSNHLRSPLPFVSLLLQQALNRTNAMKRPKRKTKTKRREPPEVNHATGGKIRGRRRLLPIWSVQHLPDSTQAFFNTKRECLEWIKRWKED